MSILSLLLSVILIGCSIEAPIPNDKPIVEVPKKEIVEIVEIVEKKGIGFDTFDSSLINYVSSSEDYKTENFVVSPVSIKLALALAVEGSKDETKIEMLNALGIENENSLRELSKEMTNISKDVDENVKSQSEWLKEWEESVNESKFIVTNSIWKNKDRLGELKEDYIKSMLENYNAKAEEISSLEMKDTINGYVKENTNNLIPTIVDDSIKDANTVLVNTVYLNDSWTRGLFDEYNTKEKDFKTINSDKVKKDFMTTQDDFLFYEDKETKLLLTETENNFGVLYVLGDNSNILEKMNKMESYEVIVEVPKMDIESEFKNKYLVGFMNSLGVNKAFSEWDADFRTMFDIPNDSNIYIEDIIHKTKLTTDEKGIEAAAATAVLMMDTTSILPIEKPKPKEFIANKPFSFYVFNMNRYYEGDFENRNFENTKLLFYGNFVK